jgi:hypothetical protein
MNACKKGTAVLAKQYKNLFRVHNLSERLSISELPLVKVVSNRIASAK